MEQQKRTHRGKNLLTFALFVAVAFVFWMLLSLDDYVERDFDVPVEFTDVPPQATLLNTPPQTISVTVRGKGSQLLRYLWGGSMPTLKVTRESYATGRRNELFVSRARMEALLRNYFGNGISINTCRPDSVKLEYTMRPGIKLPLIIESNVTPDRQNVISGPLRANVDSVTVYSTGPIPRSLKAVYTTKLTAVNVADTTRYRVKLKPIPNVKVVPSEVIVTVPVEPLIAKRKMIHPEVTNVPIGTSVICFPTKVEVSYLVPMSMYSEDFHIVAYADYNDIQAGVEKIPLTVSLTSEILRSVSLKPDSVEYIVQHR